MSGNRMTHESSDSAEHSDPGHGDETAASPRTASPTTSLAESWVAIGEIVGPFGVRGELKVSLSTDFPERFLRTPIVYIGDSHTPYAVLGARLHKGQALLRLEGIDAVEGVERLRGKRLAIPEAEITPLPPDQFYQHDLIGLRVERMDGRSLGIVAEIVTGGGGDLFLVRDERSGTETLLPAVKEFVKGIDLGARVMRVEPIPGLFDDQADEAR